VSFGNYLQNRSTFGIGKDREQGVEKSIQKAVNVHDRERLNEIAMMALSFSEAWTPGRTSVGE